MWHPHQRNDNNNNIIYNAIRKAMRLCNQYLLMKVFDVKNDNIWLTNDQPMKEADDDDDSNIINVTYWWRYWKVMMTCEMPYILQCVMTDFWKAWWWKVIVILIMPVIITNRNVINAVPYYTSNVANNENEKPILLLIIIFFILYTANGAHRIIVIQWKISSSPNINNNIIIMAICVCVWQ